jgi:hypothetical protein
VLKKSLATLAAFLLGLGLTISAVTPATADDLVPAATESTAPTDVVAPEEEAAPQAAPSEDVVETPDPPADDNPAPEFARATSYPAPTKLYGVALYVYKKLDPAAPAAWENSGKQTLVIEDVDNTSEATNNFWSTFPGTLPAGVCGTGWAVQQDKVSFVGSFAFPSNITYPVDNIGWPPIYQAQHSDLSSLIQVPACDVKPTTTEPSCTADGTLTLPALAGVTWYIDNVLTPAGTVDRPAGANVVVKATANTAGILPGAPRDSYTGKWTLTWKLSFSFPTCQEPELVGSIASICLNDAPYLHYSVTLNDPDGLSTGDTAVLSLTDGVETYTYSPDLGTITDGVTLEGDLLWPGASVDPITHEANGWPGWEQVGGVWQETTGNYSWTRDGVTATIKVNPEITADLEYPPGNPDCYPGPREVTPTLTDLAASCEADGSFTLDDIPGVQWWIGGEPVLPGTYSGDTPSTKHVTATAAGGHVLAPNAQTTWDLAFSAPEECLTLAGSTATGKCEADSPWIYYDITLTDPFGVASDHDADLIMSDGVNTVTIPLGTVDPTTLTLSGKVLWPGASVDPVTGEATGWPGWEQVGGVWQETTGNFAWTRLITSAVLSVNPSIPVTLAYPPATPSCVMEPPHDPPTLGVFPTNAELSEQCTADGTGVLTLGQVDGVSFFDDVNYFIDGVPATSSTVYLQPGTYVVTVTTKSPTDGLDGPTAWRVVVTGGETCGDLETLALTGAPAGGWLALAAVLMAIGAGLVATRRRRAA